MIGRVRPWGTFEGPTAVSEDRRSGDGGPMGLFEGPTAVSEDRT
jgi:hypothetical protein